MIKPPIRPARVLIVHHGDQYCEVYADDPSAVVKIINVPHFYSAEGELLVEQLVASRLPQYWRSVYEDGHLVARDAIRDLRMDDILARDIEIAVSAALNRASQRSQMGVAS